MTITRNKKTANGHLPSPEDLLEMASTLVLIRLLDERLWLLNRQGKAAIVASCQGHEAAQLGAVWAMREAPSAAYFPYYRSMATMIGAGLTPTEVMLGFMAKAGEPLSGARQFPLHGARPDLKVFNQSNVVSTQIPHAVGYALACKMTKDPTVTITTFGDGGTSEGDFHEGMNFAGVHKLPVIFFCENNRYAISVPLSKQMAITKIANRAASYGMPGVTVDGTDILAVYQATTDAIKRIASGGGPTLIEANVERYLPHTSDDDDRRYRTADELKDAKKRDPIKLFESYLVKNGILTDAIRQRIYNDAKHQVDQATDTAEAAPFPDTDDFYEDVYAS